MRRLVLSLSVLSFIVAGSSASFAQTSRKSREPEWQLFESEKYHFKAMFPGKPKDVTKKPGTNFGEVTVSHTTLEWKELVYAVTATQYPDKFKDADTNKLFAKAKDALSAHGGKIISEEAVKITGADGTRHEGFELVVEYGKTQIRTRIVLVDLVLYQVSVTGKKDAVGGELAKKYLANFEVTK